MQKIKFAVLDKFFSNVTNSEISFLLHISKYQNDKGIVKGVYYKEACKQLDISFQKFYDLKKSLEEKNIIKTFKGNYIDWDIQILDNDFSNPDSFKEGYINTNHDIFYNKEFLSMKSGEKLLAMQFMKITFSGRGSYNIGVDKFYDKYTKLLNVTKRVIQNYMTTLKNFFSIGIKNREYWITPLAKVFRSNGSTYNRAEIDTYNKHVGETICRREKIKFTNKTLLDTVNLLKQYKKQLQDKAEELLCTAMVKSIEKINEGIRNPYKWERVLQPKLVHKLLRKEIDSLSN